MAKYKEKSNEEKKADIQKCIEKLEDGVRNVFESDNYKEWLKMFSKFYNYSFNNVILILSQRPDARICNSFTTWKSLNRIVKKGSIGIKILCPCPFKYQSEEEVYENGAPIHLSDGSVKKEVIERDGIRFRIGYTFDVEDTQGEDFPSLVKPLDESPEFLKNVISQIVATSPISITFDNNLENCYGYYHLENNNIVVKGGLTTLHTIKTMIHELAHSQLHNLNEAKVSREQREIEAESCAFVALNYFGFNTDDYSFGYVAGYSKDKEIDVLKSSISTIEKQSRKLIEFLSENTDLKILVNTISKKQTA